MDSFGELLHSIRKRQNATQLVKKVGISYVYLLDIEKGARPAPKDNVLLALADNLDFYDGEKELFFDLAAKERNCIPVDVSRYIMGNADLINILRYMEKRNLAPETIKLIESDKKEDSNGNR